MTTDTDLPRRESCRHCRDRISVDRTTGRFLLHSQTGKRCPGSGQTPEEQR